MHGRMNCAIKNKPYLSISTLLVRHINESWIPAAKAVRETSPKSKGE